jgi:ABC-2 type transport system permease protein
MTALLALILKDIRVYLVDKRALMMHLMLPIVMAAFFGYLFGGTSSSEASKIEIAIVNKDAHTITDKIVKALQAESSLAVQMTTESEAEALVRKGKAALFILIPKGFGESAGNALFRSDKKPELILNYDPSQSMVMAMAKGILTQHVMQVVSSEMFSGQGGSKIVQQGLQELEAKADKSADESKLLDLLRSVNQYQTRETTATEANENARGGSGLSMPFTTTEVALQAKNSMENKYNGYAHSFAGMAVQFILFMSIDAGISILLARRLGLWNRLMAAPISMNVLLLARGLSCALIAFVLCAFIFSVAALVFQVKILGSVVGFVLVMVMFSLMCASFGLLIAAFGKTPEASRGIAIFVTMLMVMLGGAWVPSFIFPQWMQTLTLFVPTRWAVDGFDAMTWRGLGFDVALHSVSVMAIFTFLFFALAMWRFRTQTQQQ